MARHPFADFVYATRVGKSEGWIPLTDVRCEAASRSIRGLPEKYYVCISHNQSRAKQSKLFVAITSLLFSINILATCAADWLRTITSDQTAYVIIRRYISQLVGMKPLDRNYWVVINLLLVLPILFYLNILKTEEILQFWNKRNSRRAWHVIPAQEVNTQ